MNVLGISCYYHDSAAALVKNGKVVAAAQEERFTRKKHDFTFPIHAINYCLKEGSIKGKDLDLVAFYDKPLLEFERVLHQHVEMFPKSFWSFYKSMPMWIVDRLRIKKHIKKKVGYRGDIVFPEHHISHAASAFLCSPFKEAAILTIDGVGEWATATLGKGKDNEIKILKELHFPHSLGLLYSTITAYLGFSVNNSEYKVMGLAPYGRPRYLNKFRKFVRINSDGSIALNMDYFSYHYKMRMPSEKMIKLLGPVRKKESELEQIHKDIAATLQKITEEAVFKMLDHLYTLTRINKVCLAGGVALNSVANGKVLKKTPFKEIYIQPAASDAGGAVGAALYATNIVLKKKREYVMNRCDLGPSYTPQEIEQYLKRNNIVYKRFQNRKELLKRTASLIWKNKVVGWFQGRMEWGPRALGNRSILSNPCNPKMQDILNLKVKHREKFRPFAPVICLEDAPSYFECDKPVPLPADFMLMVYPIKKEKRKLIPAVTHIDGTGRLQTIRREQNPLYYDLIKEFGKLSGVPILINTSFNIRGEPIVCTPQDAYRCMMGTGIDCLIIDKFIVKREDNLKDAWDSEKVARD